MQNIDRQFRATLKGMDRDELNRLDMRMYSKDRRRMIDQERVRRKKADTPDPTIESLVNIIADLQVNSGESSSAANEYEDNHGSTSPTGNPSGKRKKPPKRSYIFPDYHPLIAEEVQNVFFKSSTREGTHYAETNLKGSFKCSNPRCRKRWTTGIIATVIRGYRQRDGQLGYNAEAYGQRCAGCDSLGYMTLEEDAYVERVVRRLKIWKGEFVPQGRKDKKYTPPHRWHLCEGCKAGICEGGV
ncbi:hypothetical protein TWF506_004704 [Arthrobotrys conoides]|uniref:3CxxC-type domain-containing protein n=1 Tax=Arthrobotrys conoides TaxID=74498 RepID=A0AAN8NB44_9PEZI